MNPNPEWPDQYAAILREFGWSEADDRAAADALRALLPRRDTFRHVGTELKHRPLATVVGCGPALDDLEANYLEGIVVAADGAATRLMELGVVPRVVVTDLDGPDDGLRWAAAQGSSMVVHAHGANRDALPLAAELGPFVAGTYQSTPAEALQPLRNLGGFTDGDRAVRLCEAYGVRTVRLAGFDLDATPGRYSGTWDPATKPAKLAWARRILDGVRKRGATQILG